MTTHNEADRLAETISGLIQICPVNPATKHPAYEALATLLALAKQQAADTRSDEEIAYAVGDIVGVGPGAWDTVHSSLIVRAFRRVLGAKQQAPEATADVWRVTVGKMARTLEQAANHAEAAALPTAMREVATRLNHLLVGVTTAQATAEPAADKPVRSWEDVDVTYWRRRAMRAEAALAAQGTQKANACVECDGTGEVFGHADDCNDDNCALNGDQYSCTGRVHRCAICATPPKAEATQAAAVSRWDFEEYVRSQWTSGYACPREGDGYTDPKVDFAWRAVTALTPPPPAQNPEQAADECTICKAIIVPRNATHYDAEDLAAARVRAKIIHASLSVDAKPQLAPAAPAGRPIETAPKDGRPLLLKLPPIGGWAAGWWRCSWSFVCEGWCLHTPHLINGKAVTLVGIGEPTEWAPLP